MGWSLHHPHGLVYYAPQYCHRGYTLFANLRGNEANLIDMEGRICHRWVWPGGIEYAKLLPNGNLLFHTRASTEPGPLDAPRLSTATQRQYPGPDVGGGVNGNHAPG